MPLTVLKGGKEKHIVCTWCGSKFFTREELNLHWAQNARCSNNKTVNNPTQQKYEVIDSGENE